jgi:hypothetical protein
MAALVFSFFRKPTTRQAMYGQFGIFFFCNKIKNTKAAIPCRTPKRL